jgi:hypothetical protein
VTSIICSPKNQKGISELNDMISQMDLMDVYRTFYTTATKYAFFSAIHGTFSKIGHILDTNQVLANIRR